MGLYVARVIVEAHGGTIGLASDGHGTEAVFGSRRGQGDRPPAPWA